MIYSLSEQLTSSFPLIKSIFQTRRKVLLDPPFLVNSSNSVTVHPTESRFLRHKHGDLITSNLARYLATCCSFEQIILAYCLKKVNDWPSLNAKWACRKVPRKSKLFSNAIMRVIYNEEVRGCVNQSAQQFSQLHQLPKKCTNVNMICLPWKSNFNGRENHAIIGN